MEIIDLYDINRNKIGQIDRSESAHADGYKLIVFACIFNSRGEMLIQKRSHLKTKFAGYWDVTAGGGVLTGEDTQTAAARELYEEMGIKVDFSGNRPALTWNLRNIFEDIYIAMCDIGLSELKFQDNEVDDARWATCEEILEMIETGSFVDCPRGLIRLLFDMSQRSDW